MLARLQKRWGVESGLQFALILIVFSLTGTSIIYVRAPVYALIGIGASAALWVKIIAFIFIAIPLYYLMLLGYGTLLGQRQFFWQFVGRSASRFKPGSRRAKAEKKAALELSAGPSGEESTSS